MRWKDSTGALVRIVEFHLPDNYAAFVDDNGYIWQANIHTRAVRVLRSTMTPWYESNDCSGTPYLRADEVALPARVAFIALTPGSSATTYRALSDGQTFSEKTLASRWGGTSCNQPGVQTEYVVPYASLSAPLDMPAQAPFVPPLRPEYTF